MISRLLLFLLIFFSLSAAAQRRVNFTINTTQDRKQINPLIYGTNDDYKFALSKRLGGNRVTNYNWENNASNAGRDWYHESDNYVPWWQGVPDNEYNVPGAALKYFHNRSLAQHAYSLVTIPMAKYVTKDKNGGVSEQQRAPSNRWLNITHRKPAALKPLRLNPDQTDNTVYTEEELNYLITTFGKSNTATGVKAYALDNEPGLWFDSHSRMWGSTPVSVKYLMDQSYQVSELIKEMDPTAEIYGPASWGVSEFENLQFAPDWDEQKGNHRNFLELYLTRMKKRGDSLNKRLLDVLDLHWYPQGNNDGANPFSDRNDYATNAARMAMTRSLWDPTYIENTWIGQDPDKVDQFLPFLPKMKSLINTHYPGTKFAITEYSYMGYGHASGGIAQADALGIFGKQGLYMATYWGAISGFVKSGFDIFLNYDGKGAKFGDVSVSSQTNDIVNSALHAAIEGSNDQKLHAVAMNKNQDEAIIATIKLEGGKTYRSARVWAFDNSNATVRQLKNVKVINNNTFEYKIPPLTVCHFLFTNEDLSLYPDVEEATIDPAVGYSDGTASFNVKLRVSDGNNDIAKVTVDLSQVGGPAAKVLTPSAGNPDTYLFSHAIPNGTVSGLKSIKILVEDATHLTAEAYLNYRVIKKTPSSLIWDGDTITKGTGQAFYDALDSKAPLIKVQRQTSGGNNGPRSLFMHFEHDMNKYNVMTWRITNGENPADAVDISDYGALEFYIRSDAPANSDIDVSLRDASAQLESSSTVSLKAGGYVSAFSKNAYTKVRIPISAFTSGSNIHLDQVWQFNFQSNTATKGFNVWVDDIRAVPYTHPIYKPVLSELAINPAKGYADGKTEVTISARATDPDNNLVSVKADLSPFDGSANQQMQLLNGRYTYTFKVPSGVSNGTKGIRITATDADENSADSVIRYSVLEKAGKTVLWDGDRVNTGKAILVNERSKVRIDTVGGKTEPKSMRVHLDKMEPGGFGSIHWDWNEDTQDSEIKDLSSKGYLSFYIKLAKADANSEVEVFMKDRLGGSTSPVKLVSGGYMSAMSTEYQLVNVPMRVFPAEEMNLKEVTRIGFLSTQFADGGIDFTLDDINAFGSNEADVKMTVTNAACGANGKIQVTSVNGGLSGYSFYINGAVNPAGAANPVFSNLVPGTYEIRIEDTKGFAYMESIVVGGSVSGITVTGAVTGGNINITVSGGSGRYTYLWSNQATTEDLTGVPAGTYAVTVTDAATGCKAVYTATVSGPATKPDALISVVNAACGVNGKISVDKVIGSAGNNKFYINSNPNPAGISNPVFSGLKPGTYAIKIDGDGGYTFTKKVVIGGSIAVPVVTGIAKNGNIDITVKGGSGIYTYEWSEGSSTQDLMEVPDGPYTVTVTDAESQCKTTFSIVLLTPGMTLTAASAQCAPNGKITVSAVKGGNGSYSYYINNVINPAGSGNSVFSGLKPGTYTIGVRDNAGFVLSRKVSVEGSGSAPVVTGVVKGRNVSVTVKGGSGVYIYKWSEGSSTRDLMEVPNGTYELLVTDAASGCTARFSAVVFVPDAELVVANAACLPNGKIRVVNLNSTGVFRYYINGKANPAGINNPEFSGLKAADYTVKVEGDKGFVWTRKTRVEGISSAPKVTSTASYGAVNLTVSGGSGIYIYEWSDGSATRDLYDAAPGNYTVTVRDAASGCSTVHQVYLATSRAALNAIIVYPNPAVSGGNVKVYYNFPSVTSRTLTLRDLTGKILLRYTLKDASGELNLVIPALPAGVYVVRVDGKDAVSKQLIVR